MNELPEEDLDHILDHTRDLWEEVRGERIFLTGGTGFFGSWFLESFCWILDRLSLRASITVLSRNPGEFAAKLPRVAAHPAISFHSGDVRSFDYPAGTFSHVIHGATSASWKLNDDDPLLMLDTIVDGTRRTLDFSRNHGTRKFLLTSSGAVYGPQPPEITHIPETFLGGPDTMRPSSVYGEGKRVAELLCAIYHRLYGIETKIARCFAFVGPHLPLTSHFAIGNFIRDFMSGGPIEVSGDGTPRRSYLYAADLMIWLWTVLFAGEVCRPYNVGSDDSLSISEVASKVAELRDRPIRVDIKQSAVEGSPRQQYVPGTRRITEELRLDPVINLTEALKRTIRWHASKEDAAF